MNNNDLKVPAKRRLVVMGLALLLILMSLACNLSGSETVVVVVTATDQELAPATNTQIVQPTLGVTPVIQTVVVTQPPAVQTVIVTQPQAPSPTPLVLRTVPIEGDQDLIQGRIIFPDYQPAATTDLVFLAEARNPSIGDHDGAGIDNVEFVIQDSEGNEVYRRTERMAHYCAFSGGEPDCVVFRFADTGYTWPVTGLPIENGPHTLFVTVNSADGNSWGGQADFNIQIP